MKPINRLALILEYTRVQEDLEALLNVPHGVKLSRRWSRTVRWLENRINKLSSQLDQRKAS